MLKSIWIPTWLYRGLPWAALLAGGLGQFCSGCLPLMAVSFAVFAYGWAILAVRVKSFAEGFSYE